MRSTSTSGVEFFMYKKEKNSAIRLVNRIYFDMMNAETEKNSFSGVTIWKLV